MLYSKERENRKCLKDGYSRLIADLLSQHGMACAYFEKRFVNLLLKKTVSQWLLCDKRNMYTLRVFLRLNESTVTRALGPLLV